MLGSLGATGKGHGNRGAVLMGLEGDAPENIDISTICDTGRNMHKKYKETARGGLAIDVIEVPVNVIEC